ARGRVGARPARSLGGLRAAAGRSAGHRLHPLALRRQSRRGRDPGRALPRAQAGRRAGAAGRHPRPARAEPDPRGAGLRGRDPGAVTLTRQRYDTPFGPLDTDHAVVDALAGALGEESAFSEELHHRREHSIELAAVWAASLLGQTRPALVPILCGSFFPYTHE